MKLLIFLPSRSLNLRSQTRRLSCAAGALSPYLLGKEESTWRMVLEADEKLLSSMQSSTHELVDLRSLMPVLPMEELAVAGHAVALSNWHKVHTAIKAHSTMCMRIL